MLDSKFGLISLLLFIDKLLFARQTMRIQSDATKMFHCSILLGKLRIEDIGMRHNIAQSVLFDLTMDFMDFQAMKRKKSSIIGEMVIPHK